MDFERTILTAAQKNAANSKNQVKYYSTKFEPPKKLERSKTLSTNIQKFLARKEQEEKQKVYDAREKREKLLELRSHDKKATRRVNVMLKRTKSANQSAIQDAVHEHSSVSMAGSSQPDEDDYGYVSQSAADFYNKMMEKYNNMPDEPKWDFTKKKLNGNLSSTKDRVKNALNKEEEEAMQPHRRKRKHVENLDEPIVEEKMEKYKKEEKMKLKIKPAPVINFNDLLKIAEKKQFEPIKVEPKKEKKEDERLLTKKQKKEQEKEREYREQREKREKDRAAGITPTVPAPAARIPKLNAGEPKATPPSTNKVNSPAPAQSSKANLNPPNTARSSTSATPSTMKKPPQKCDISPSNKRSELPPRPAPQVSNGHLRKDNHNPPPRPSNAPRDRDRDQVRKPTTSNGSSSAAGRDVKPSLKPKPLMPRDSMRPKQFPPPDVRRNGNAGPPSGKRKGMPVKGRIYDDSDEEYDSEMDDFIDDGPEADEDYSKHIREMFGYDKRKYRHIDDEDDNMESSYAQQMREEVISTKIGIMEDLEEQRKEDEHTRRKAQMKKQR